ncbi:MAG: Crp/Fnr family transcriptional regulator [Flavobacteriales bacterium]|nr:Crp/Fnr family transcriptional regulator [Flavobacteriales bacterium]MBK9288874.1 Crp/Fnr family transcriptional regulator [Flavobacteriales bacterium]
MSTIPLPQRDALQAELRQLFPDLYEPEVLKGLMEEGTLIELKEGDRMMEIGQYIKQLPLVISGSLKVLREDEEGRELLLYHVGPGQSCAMAITCCMGDARSTVRVIADEDTTLLALPTRLLDDWSTRYRSWKAFVMHQYQKRFDELLKVIDGVAFRKLDDRLWKSLRDRAQRSGATVVKASHQELADELHSSREVISRLLKQMEREGLVRMGRQQVELLKS